MSSNWDASDSNPLEDFLRAKELLQRKVSLEPEMNYGLPWIKLMLGHWTIDQYNAVCLKYNEALKKALEE
jgi:hypothetical protein